MTFPIFPSGVSTANLYATDSLSGRGISALIGADPGFINDPVIFEPPPQLSGGEPVVWVVATGASPNWGGCQVFMSVDNVSYGAIGIIFTGGVQGVLTNTLPSHADPDTTNTLSIDISESGPKAQIISCSAVMANDFIPLVYVDGELVAYSLATLTGVSAYDLTTLLRRGVYGTTIGSHASGSKFAVLSQLTYRQGYLPNLVGQTIYMKFPSFNLVGAALQDLSTVPYYTFLLTGHSIPPSPVACPVDLALAAGTAALDWGVLGSPFTSTCDWGELGSLSTLSVDMGTIDITG